MTQLRIEQVSQNFAGLQALSHVDLTVDTGATGKGRVVGLIGPNGAGKTTLLNCISGLAHPSSGRILLDDRPIERLAAYQISRLGIARTYQNIRLFREMTALGNVLVGQHQLGRAGPWESLWFGGRWQREERQFRARGLELLARLGLAALANTAANNLAYGDQRRLEMARALATEPKLLLLDEPAAGMNAVETAILGDEILRAKASGLGILLVEHDMALVGQVCDEVYVLNFGEIIAHGEPDTIKSDPIVIEAYLGKDGTHGKS